MLKSFLITNILLCLFQNHTMLLHRYLKEFYPKTGMQKFAEAFTIISYAREATEIYKKRLSV